MTMLFSFLKNNSWFLGDILVISSDISVNSKNKLKVFPRLNIVSPSIQLQQRLDGLCNEMPAFRNRIARFYSLEIFRFHAYERVLYLDSDMIVVRNISELLELNNGLYACRDWYTGNGRRISDFNPAHGDECDAEIIKTPVNTGFLLLSGPYIQPGLYERLVETITPSQWSGSTTLYTDQLILNKFFNGVFTILDARYNYRPKNSQGILKAEGIAANDAKIIHFILKAKPWNPGEVLKTSASNLELLRFYEQWYAWYFDFLDHFHLYQKINMITG
jgi:lipopolysaccharide biosynthesis glycosyltransferase